MVTATKRTPAATRRIAPVAMKKRRRENRPTVARPGLTRPTMTATSPTITSTHEVVWDQDISFPLLVADGSFSHEFQEAAVGLHPSRSPALRRQLSVHEVRERIAGHT
jgi:hypothetical protein